MFLIKATLPSIKFHVLNKIKEWMRIHNCFDPFVLFDFRTILLLTLNGLYLTVLSVPTDSASLPVGWTDRDVTLPLVESILKVLKSIFEKLLIILVIDIEQSLGQ